MVHLTPLARHFKEHVCVAPAVHRASNDRKDAQPSAPPKLPLPRSPHLNQYSSAVSVVLSSSLKMNHTKSSYDILPGVVLEKRRGTWSQRQRRPTFERFRDKSSSQLQRYECFLLPYPILQGLPLLPCVLPTTAHAATKY